MKTRIIGLGNPILGDEGAGLHVVRRLKEVLAPEREHFGLDAEMEIIESEVAGFALLELAAGWERLIIVDAVHAPDTPPGTVLQLTPDDPLPSLRLRAVHEIDLPTALALGKEIGQAMPREVIVLGIQASEGYRFQETLSPPVSAAIADVLVRLRMLLE